MVVNIGLLLILWVIDSPAIPPLGYAKVAYYTFDATPVDQGTLSLTDFTDNANIVVVFEGTLWELADTVHYDTQWMRNKVYGSKKRILEDIRKLRERGVCVLMNVDDAASWSTTTPFTTWNGKGCDYRQFATFVDSCVDVAGFDGIALDVEHKAEDNVNYRNLIREFGKYMGPLSSDSSTKLYTAALYYGKQGAPGPSFREAELHRNLNFIMEMGYARDNMERFNYWADYLGNSKVMVGMSHQDNPLSSAVAWASWHPEPEKAGVMVYAANVNKVYTDSIFSALGEEIVNTRQKKSSFDIRRFRVGQLHHSLVFHVEVSSGNSVSLQLFSVNGRKLFSTLERNFIPGMHTIRWQPGENGNVAFAPGMYYAILKAGGNSITVPCVLL